jgi:YLP motif-containing protein 1
MDQHHHHHHQQQQWRPMPIPGNICPTCSISHFPFCPPQPPFNQNPRPPFDPYHGLTGPPHPFTDGFADPRQWRRNPSLDRESYGQFQLQSYSNGFTNEGDRNSKRPRVDDIQNNQNSVRNSSDFERRLRLIRDHGGTLTGPPHEGGPGSMPGMNNLETNRYVQESSGFDGNYDGTGVGEYRKFHDPRFGSSDRIGQHYMQSNRNGFHNEEEFAHSRYGQVESSLHPFQTYGINNVDQPPPLHISQRVPYPGSEVPKDNYHNAHNPQWRQSSDSVPANEPKYSHMNAYPEPRGSAVMDDRGPKNQLPQPYGMQYPVDMRHDFHSSGLPSDVRQPFEVGFHSQDGNQGPIRHQSMPGVTQHGAPNMSERGGYFPSPSGRSMVFENTGQMEASRFYSRQPPIPSSPPPPLPVEPALRSSSELKTHSSPPNTTASLFPVPVSSSAMVSSSYPPIPDAHSLTPPYFHNKPLMHASTDFFSEAARDGQPFSLKQLSSNKPKVIDASHLFKQPHRATRPDHIVIILRGLPGNLF